MKMTDGTAIYISSGDTVIHYRLPSGTTVRVGLNNILLCLTCLQRDCKHVFDVQELHADMQAKLSARAAAAETHAHAA